VMDLDPAAVEAAAFALAKPGSLPDWLSISALGRDMTPLAEIAVAADAPLIARATADAIADKIEALVDGYDEDDEAFSQAAAIARSHGSQAQTTEDGQ